MIEIIDDITNTLSYTQLVPGKLNSTFFEKYEEIPVHVKTFITDPYFLGERILSTSRIQGIFDHLKDTYPNQLSSSKSDVIILEGPSTDCEYIGLVGTLYSIYRTLCLYDPSKSLGRSTTLKYLIYSSDETSTSSLCRELNSMILNSIYFKSIAHISDTSISFPKNIELVYVSDKEVILGEQFLGGIVSESRNIITSTKFNHIVKGIIDRMYAGYGSNIEKLFIIRDSSTGDLIL